jgi:hypothetical protein
VWFGPGRFTGQLVENGRRWAEVTRLSGFPEDRQRFVQGATFLVAEVVTLVVRDQVDNSPFGQRGRLVENEPPLLDTVLGGGS